MRLQRVRFSHSSTFRYLNYIRPTVYVFPQLRTLIAIYLGGLSFPARRLEGVVLGQHMFPFSPVSFSPHDFHFFLHLSSPSTTNFSTFVLFIAVAMTIRCISVEVPGTFLRYL